MKRKLGIIQIAVFPLSLLIFSCSMSKDIASKMDEYTNGITITINGTTTNFNNDFSSITLVSNKPDATIRYTDDGITTPDRNTGTIYTGPFIPFSGQKIQAVAYTTDQISMVASITHGDGTSAYPYEIATAQQLKNLSELVINDNSNYAEKNYKQIADIDLSTQNPWTPIGMSSATDYLPFTGNYDGGGHTIKRLTVNRPGEDYNGLFGYIDTVSSTNGLKNINISEAVIIGRSRTAVLAGFFKDGEIVSCTVSNSTVTFSYENDTDPFTNTSRAGGMVGMATSPNSITKCNVTGTTIKGQGTYIGGFVGSCQSANKITECHVNGTRIEYNVKCDYVGGFAGIIVASNIETCSSSIDIDMNFATNDSESIGGFAGFCNDSDITFCYSEGNINGSFPIYDFGGFIGNFQITTSNLPVNTYIIKNCYSRFDVSILGDNHGGFIGNLSLSGSDLFEINYCYSTGSISPIGTSIGGFIGLFSGSILTTTSNYWLKTSSINNTLVSIPGYSFSGIDPLDIGPMKLWTSYSGWDFVGEIPNGTLDFWKTGTLNDGYPYLTNNPPPN